jgi:hypothetical protein
MRLRWLVRVAEGVTGLILVAYPPIVTQAVFDAEIAGADTIMARLTGIALIGLRVACWPGKSAHQQLYGMLTYSTLAMLYHLRIGIRGAPVGILLWPAVVVHAVLSVFLVIAHSKERKTPVT